MLTNHLQLKNPLQVEDVDKLMPVFHGHESERLKHGAKGPYIVLQDAEDPQHVLLLLPWDTTVEEGKEFIAKEVTQAAFANAGLISGSMYFLNVVEEKK